MMGVNPLDYERANKNLEKIKMIPETYNEIIQNTDQYEVDRIVFLIQNKNKQTNQEYVLSIEECDQYELLLKQIVQIRRSIDPDRQIEAPFRAIREIETKLGQLKFEYCADVSPELYPLLHDHIREAKHTNQLKHTTWLVQRTERQKRHLDPYIAINGLMSSKRRALEEIQRIEKEKEEYKRKYEEWESKSERAAASIHDINASILNYCESHGIDSSKYI
jgi:hypothetical protein